MPRHPVGTRSRRTDRTPDRRKARGHLVASRLTTTSAGSPLDISFEARPQTMTHVVSSSTTDSATLLGLLVGLYPAEDGDLTLDGAPVGQVPLASSRSSVVLVLQDPWIMSGTVADNIAFADPTVGRGDIEAVASLACLDELIAHLPDGLDTSLDYDNRFALTIGHRRLIALARALLRNPAVLLIEDPFRDLTAREETTMIRAVNQAGRNRTTVVTTQRFDPAMFTTDQVLLLEGGRLRSVTADGKPVPRQGPPPHPDPTAAQPPSPAVGFPSPAALDLEAGSDLGHGYRAASLLRREALTETWLAWHANSASIVEAKVARGLALADAARIELSVEYDRARRLQHPGIASPVAAHLTDRRPFAVYERVGGSYLSQLIGPMAETPQLDVAAIGAAISRTLSFIHRLQFAHLDIGPDVIKLTNPGAMITDLRHALPLGAPNRRELPPNRLGLVAPEQLAGEPISSEMDIYALGCLLFQAATGSLLTSQAGPDVSDIDAFLRPSVADVVASMLAPDPEQRPTAADVLGRLRPLVVPLEPRHEIENFAMTVALGPSGSGDDDTAPYPVIVTNALT
ncbi:MAG: protein kinase domain-containing protein [Acidimicrobiales bacterium]